MAVSRRRPTDDDEDDAPSLAVLPTDDDDLDDDEDGGVQAQYVTRRPSRPAADDDDAADQVVPDRIVPLKLPKPWAHLKIYAWLDYPDDVAACFNPKAEDETVAEAGERVMDGLRQVIVKHAGWRDGRGHVYPQPTKRGFWEQIPNPLAAAIGAAFREAVRADPTPPASPKPRRRR